MAGKKRLERGPLPEQLKLSAVDGQSDARLLRLAETMRLAEQTLQAAMEELANAEQRLSQTPRKKGGRRPGWYDAAVRRERKAGAALEDIYKAMMRVRARTRPGLAIKVTVLATLYGEVLEQGPDQSDMVSVMIHSLLTDVSD